MKNLRVFLVVLLVLAIGVGYVSSTGMLKRNIADLIRLSELIVVGRVVSVTDGLQGNVPYTEITLGVSKSIRGDISGTYTFRQFGLLRPRDMGNGMINANVSPDGWPRFEEGEQVLAFLYKAGEVTGLRTTVGLFQGKFNIKDGRLTNAIDNLGLFQNVSLPAQQLSKKEQSLLQSKKGPMNSEAFIAFVTRAVNEGWFK